MDNSRRYSAAEHSHLYQANVSGFHIPKMDADIQTNHMYHFANFSTYEELNEI